MTAKGVPRTLIVRFVGPSMLRAGCGGSQQSRCAAQCRAHHHAQCLARSGRRERGRRSRRPLRARPERVVRAGVRVASRAGSGDEGGQRDGAARTLDDGSGARSLCAPYSVPNRACWAACQPGAHRVVPALGEIQLSWVRGAGSKRESVSDQGQTSGERLLGRGGNCLCGE